MFILDVLLARCNVFFFFLFICFSLNKMSQIIIVELLSLTYYVLDPAQGSLD